MPIRLCKANNRSNDVLCTLSQAVLDSCHSCVVVFEGRYGIQHVVAFVGDFAFLAWPAAAEVPTFSP